MTISRHVMIIIIIISPSLTINRGKVQVSEGVAGASSKRERLGQQEEPL